MNRIYHGLPSYPNAYANTSPAKTEVFSTPLPQPAVDSRFGSPMPHYPLVQTIEDAAVQRSQSQPPAPLFDPSGYDQTVPWQATLRSASRDGNRTDLIVGNNDVAVARAQSQPLSPGQRGLMAQ